MIEIKIFIGCKTNSNIIFFLIAYCISIYLLELDLDKNIKIFKDKHDARQNMKQENELKYVVENRILGIAGQVNLKELSI